LAAELATPRATGQPNIFENRIGQTQRYNVSVLWDDWADLPMQARARVILDAYESAFPDRAPGVAIAMGLSTEDAVNMGWFPFTIEPDIARSDVDLRSRVTKAMSAEGLVAGALRFRTLEETKAARNRLRSAVPDAEWIIIAERRDGESPSEAEAVSGPATVAM
jgi:hypothetical protein